MVYDCDWQLLFSMNFHFAVKAHDGDRGINNPIQYSLASKSDRFAISDETGVIYTKTKLDREESRDDQIGSYILEIIATEIDGNEVITEQRIIDKHETVFTKRSPP